MLLTDEPYWEVSGPRKYLNIPTPAPDHWQAKVTFGMFPRYQTVEAWGATEATARTLAYEKMRDAVGQSVKPEELK